MEKITSAFTVNHLKLVPVQVYVSRRDIAGDNHVTNHIRMTRPNYEPVMNTAEDPYNRKSRRNLL